MKKLTILTLMLFTTNIIAGSANLNALADQVIGENILPLLDLSSFTRFSKGSKRFLSISQTYKGKHPKAIRLGSSIEEPSYWFFEQLAPEQIAQLGFENPKILEEKTKEILTKLPNLETKGEKIIANEIWSQIWGQTWGYLWALVVREAADEAFQGQISSQNWDLFKSHLREEVRNVAGVQVWTGIRDQIRAHIGGDVRAQIGNLIVPRLRDQLLDENNDKIKLQMKMQIEKAISTYPNWEVLAEERIKVITELIPTIARALTVYHYFFVQALFEPSKDGVSSIFEVLVDQFKGEDAEGILSLDAIYNAAKPQNFEDMRENIENFLFPIQKYSQHFEN